MQRGVIDLAKIVNDNLKKKISSFPDAIKREKDAEAAAAKLESQKNYRTERTVSSKPATKESSSRPAARTSAPAKDSKEDSSSKPPVEKKDSDRPR